MMILHCVFVNFRSEANVDDRNRTYADLASLKDKIEGYVTMVSGANASFEGMARGYDDGFIITFANRAAHLAYHEHPDHKAAGARLAQLCEGGLDGCRFSEPRFRRLARQSRVDRSTDFD